jgi:hypothetical protein
MRNDFSGGRRQLEESQEGSDLGNGQRSGCASGGHVAERVRNVSQPVDIPVIEPVGDKGNIGSEYPQAA